jgi:hypothetical protein
MAIGALGEGGAGEEASGDKEQPEKVGVNGLVVFCQEELVYLFVIEVLFLRAGEAIYIHCSFEEIAGGHQHYDDGDEKEEGYSFYHDCCFNGTKLDLWFRSINVAMMGSVAVFVGGGAVKCISICIIELLRRGMIFIAL